MFFSLVASNILSLSLIFVSFITMCLSVFLGFILSGNSLLRSFSLSLFSFWDRYNANVGAFDLVLEVSEAVFISFPSFLCILFCGRDFHQSGLQAVYLFFCLKSSATDGSSRYFLFISVCLFF